MSHFLEDMAPPVEVLRMMVEMVCGMKVERRAKGRRAAGQMRVRIAGHRSLLCSASQGA
jgi:hypothetical protein